jgi:uncharacterized repeat protein (TIGR03803 family)
MWNFARLALSTGAVALFAGCGALGQGQPDTPSIGAPGTLPQAGALAARSDSTNYRVVYSFSGFPDARTPYAGLIDAGGTLYGTTYFGGSSYSSGPGVGTVFSVTPSGTENVLHNFGSESDGINPAAGLIDVSGTFYGTTSGGGSNTKAPRCTGSDYFPCGTVFSMTPSGTETLLHSFGDGTDGLDPVAALIDLNGKLYGTTSHGGHGKCNGGCGTVFSITPSGTEKVLHSFLAGSDGAGPAASLIDVKGLLYGTTAGGGAYGGGTVFSITPSGKEKVVHSFGKGTDGFLPVAALIDVNGTLYGTTEVGGKRMSGHFCNQTGNCGTVFSVTTGGREKVLHRFVGDGTDGASPVAPLIDVKGTLYGTTQYGGAYASGSKGTIFSITLKGTEKVLHNFGSDNDGAYPAAGLIDVNGTLYGTTTGGGAGHLGTVFAFAP